MGPPGGPCMVSVSIPDPCNVKPYTNTTKWVERASPSSALPSMRTLSEATGQKTCRVGLFESEESQIRERCGDHHTHSNKRCSSTPPRRTINFIINQERSDGRTDGRSGGHRMEMYINGSPELKVEGKVLTRVKTP